MYTIFWVTAGALYYKVNPIVGSRRDKDAYDYEYYLVVDESSPFFHLNSTDLISSNSLAIREEPKMYRRKREVDTSKYFNLVDVQFVDWEMQTLLDLPRG